jgi:hypothetical protein
MVFSGIVIGETLKLTENAEKYEQCRGSVSPSMTVVERPSVTSAKRIRL